ncbi:MAG: hypothetical protein LBR68_05980 [Lachnoclostridium sp.]|nr:hypothetical protein [Lachnoclostridium sp.]
MDTSEILRPPFYFPISEELESAIYHLIEAITTNNMGMVGAWENEIHALSRELPQGSEEEQWIVDYYVYAGWQEELDG